MAANFYVYLHRNQLSEVISVVKYLTKELALEAAIDYKTNNREYFLNQGYSERYLNGNN